MRHVLLALVAAAAATLPAEAAVDHYRPLDVRGYHHYRYHGRFAEARQLILSRNLLTPEQLRCAEILPGDKALGQVTQVRVVRRPSLGCAAEAAGPPFLFDLYIDNASGSFQWTPEGADDLEELPYLGDVRGTRVRGE